ncbi:hypothetical protein ATANTOWER_025656 [Ataeniobius toweri]|uniref:Uncharacterized protein n=1 Tax=Ataeniobius toweri TaxID=208326 RepID=A0ABU7ASM7_9TELE|nr:hypothetical protein [Ataeniobius toweri]
MTHVHHKASTSRPFMSGSVMKWEEGGVQGWGGKDWGAKCSPREPARRLNPIGTPVRSKLGIGTGPREPTGDRDQHPAGIAQTLKPRYPAPTPSPLAKDATGPQKNEPVRSLRSNDQECGPTPKKKKRSRPPSPVQPEYATQRREHDQQPPNPWGRANRAPSPRCPAPDRSHNQATRARKHIPHQHRGRQ